MSDELCICEDTEVCKHINLTEREFVQESIHVFEGSIIINIPQTAKFKCKDCDSVVEIYIVGGVFNY